LNTLPARSFVDYYVSNDISPVHQDISDLARHFDRRSALYRSLGIAPLAVTGRRILEFGPGSGHNALHTVSFEPAYYVLVDANPRGVRETRAMLAAASRATEIVVVESLVEDFTSSEPFDLVLAENLIPFQRDPAAFANAMAAFVSAQGLIVLTCVDSVSHLSEIARRLIAARIAPAGLPLAERVAALRPVFASHAATLDGMSRSLDHWIMDNITQPLVGKTFSIPDALAALGDRFDVFGASPDFVTDWRWYKSLYGERRQFNARTTDAYYANVINFLDYRSEFPPHDPETGRDIATACDAIYAAMQGLESNPGGSLDRIVDQFARLGTLVAPIAPATAASIDELLSILNAPPGSAPQTPAFDSFFGRGTQYLSFVRRPASR